MLELSWPFSQPNIALHFLRSPALYFVFLLKIAIYRHFLVIFLFVGGAELLQIFIIY